MENIRGLFEKANALASNFRTLLETAEIYVVIYDEKDEKIVAGSRKYFEAMGYSMQELNAFVDAGIPIKDVFYPRGDLESQRTTTALGEALQGA